LLIWAALMKTGLWCGFRPTTIPKFTKGHSQLFN